MANLVIDPGKWQSGAAAVFNPDVWFTMGPVSATPITGGEIITFSGTFIAYGQLQPLSQNLVLLTGSGNCAVLQMQFTYDSPTSTVTLSGVLTISTSTTPLQFTNLRAAVNLNGGLSAIPIGKGTQTFSYPNLTGWFQADGF